MSRALEWQPSAVKDLERMDPKVRLRIREAVYRLVDTGHGDVKRLKGSEEFRLRVGDWRVRFVRIGGLTSILRVLPRGEAYR